MHQHSVLTTNIIAYFIRIDNQWFTLCLVTKKRNEYYLLIGDEFKVWKA